MLITTQRFTSQLLTSFDGGRRHIRVNDLNQLNHSWKTEVFINLTFPPWTEIIKIHPDFSQNGTNNSVFIFISSEFCLFVLAYSHFVWDWTPYAFSWLSFSFWLSQAVAWLCHEGSSILLKHRLPLIPSILVSMPPCSSAIRRARGRALLVLVLNPHVPCLCDRITFCCRLWLLFYPLAVWA